jgi:hypothetical protein
LYQQQGAGAHRRFLSLSFTALEISQVSLSSAGL